MHVTVTISECNEESFVRMSTLGPFPLRHENRPSRGNNFCSPTTLSHQRSLNQSVNLKSNLFEYCSLLHCMYRLDTWYIYSCICFGSYSERNLRNSEFCLTGTQNTQLTPGLVPRHSRSYPTTAVSGYETTLFQRTDRPNSPLRGRKIAIPSIRRPSR